MNRFNRNRNLSFLLIFTLIASSIMSLASCSAVENETETIGIAVTILPQAEFVESIGGDKVEVTVMVPPGASPHSYEPTPTQMAALSRAQLYAMVGSGVEFELVWMDKLTAANKDMTVIDCSEGVELQEMAASAEHEHSEENHEHGTLDPHIWMSPLNAIVMVENIASGLTQIDPVNREYYEENRDSYILILESLDRSIHDRLSVMTNRIFMTYHPSFGYYASAYGLTMIPIEDEGKEPTPAGLQYVIDQANEHDIKVVFASPQFNPESARVIASAIDGRVAVIDPLARDYAENLCALTGEMAQGGSTCSTTE